MYNQTEKILSQYELEIGQMTKGRGFLVCETDKGTKLLCPFKGSGEKGERLKRYLDALKELGYQTETILTNKNGDAVTTDEVTGERFWIKDAVKGEELNTSHFREMIEAAGMLAEYHNASVKIGLEQDGVPGSNIIDASVRHARELVKVKNYIRSKKKKQVFEQIYMSCFQEMHQIAEKSCEILCREERNKPVYVMCHGDCNQHNIIWTNEAWKLVNFENAGYSWSVCDLATYMRKMMEKNGWDEELGMALLQEYHRSRPLSQGDYQKLCGLLLFPEKFWKVANHYMSSNKAWIPEKDIEKLKKVIGQEKHRLNFVENLFSIRME